MIDPIEHATNEYYKNIEHSEKMLEQFHEDIKDDISLIEEAILRIKDIEKGYESFDFESEWIEMIKDMM